MRAVCRHGRRVVISDVRDLCCAFATYTVFLGRRLMPLRKRLLNNHLILFGFQRDPAENGFGRRV
jgi:hypothetical protein